MHRNCWRFLNRDQRDEAMVDRGPDGVEYTNQLPDFCLAIEKKASLPIIQCVIERRKGLGLCKKKEHKGSVFHCAISRPHPSGTVEVLKLLIRNGFVLKRAPNLMCFALRHGHDIQTIGFLKNNGVPLNTCPKHLSVWFCLTKTRTILVDADLVRLFLSSAPCVGVADDANMTPLQHVLLKCAYDTEAIKLMLNSVKSVDLNYILDLHDNTLLHLAVKNPYQFSLSVLNLLVERGVNVNNFNNYGETVLDQILSSYSFSRESVKFLLEKGIRVNLNTIKLVLSRFSIRGVNVEVFSLFLTTALPKSFYRFIYEYILPLEIPNSCFLYALRMYFLEVDYGLSSLNPDHPKYQLITNFRNKCKIELMNMKSKNIGPNRTLMDLLIAGSTFRGAATNAEEAMQDLDSLLRAIGKDAYPLYLPIVADKIGRRTIIEKLQQVQVFALKYPSEEDEDKKIRRVFLNNDCLLHVAKKLKNVDLLHLILVFFNLDVSLSIVQTPKQKRRSESSEGPSKQQKVYK